MTDLYEGLHNLGVLPQAKNYNAHLLSIVLGSGLDARAVVDFGAGLGTFAAGCRAAGMKVACIEPDHSLRLRLDQLGFETYNTLDHVSLESVDYIYTLNVLEHIDDDAEILIQLYKCLRPTSQDQPSYIASCARPFRPWPNISREIPARTP